MLNRRAFLTLTAAAGLAAAGAVAFIVGRSSPRPQLASVDDATRLLALLGDPAAAAPTGAAYLEAHPAEADRDRLVAILSRELRDDGAATASLGAAVDRRIRRDFQQGRTVEIEGWLLSLTEARLCALARLLRTAGGA